MTHSFPTRRSSEVCLYQSIPPFVWLANPYQNNGVTSLSYRSLDSTTAPFSADPYNQNIPAGGRPSYQIDSIGPDFKLPSVYQFSLGYDTELLDRKSTRMNSSH